MIYRNEFSKCAMFAKTNCFLIFDRKTGRVRQEDRLFRQEDMKTGRQEDMIFRQEDRKTGFLDWKTGRQVIREWDKHRRL